MKPCARLFAQHRTRVLHNFLPLKKIRITTNLSFKEDPIHRYFMAIIFKWLHCHETHLFIIINFLVQEYSHIKIAHVSRYHYFCVSINIVHKLRIVQF